MGVQSVYKISEPTSRELSAWVEPFIRFPNLSPGDCQQGVQLECICSQPPPRGLSAGGASCFTVSKFSSRGLSAGDLDCLLS